MKNLFLPTVLLSLHQAAATSQSLPLIFSNSEFQPNEIIERDVAVIGGGASGTYAAVRLRDLNKSSIIVELQEELGGHTQTYRDPQNGVTTNIGVEIYPDIDITRSFFGRFNVSLANFQTQSFEQGHENANADSGTQSFDFRTGQKVTTPPVSVNETAAALERFLTLMNKYPYLYSGFYLEYPVPEELLMPFGEVVKMYDLGPAVRTLYDYAQGLGAFLDQLTIYVFKNFAPVSVESILNSTWLGSQDNDNQELYVKAHQWLGSENVWVNSSVMATSRPQASVSSRGSNDTSTERIQLLVSTPDGLKLIRAKTVLLTAPPILSNLEGWDLDEEEHSLFSQLSYSALYTGVVNNTGLSPADDVFEATQANTSFSLPTLPGTYNFEPAIGIPSAFQVKYGSPVPLPLSRVKDDILASLKRLPRNSTGLEDPDFLIFRDHTPYEQVVDEEAIANGYYVRLNGLQGRHNMFYTGATFDTQGSSLLWRFTEERVLPQLLARLQ